MWKLQRVDRYTRRERRAVGAARRMHVFGQLAVPREIRAGAGREGGGLRHGLCNCIANQYCHAPIMPASSTRARPPPRLAAFTPRAPIEGSESRGVAGAGKRMRGHWGPKRGQEGEGTRASIRLSLNPSPTLVIIFV